MSFRAFSATSFAVCSASVFCSVSSGSLNADFGSLIISFSFCSASVASFSACSALLSFSFVSSSATGHPFLAAQLYHPEYLFLFLLAQ